MYSSSLQGSRIVFLQLQDRELLSALIDKALDAEALSPESHDKGLLSLKEKLCGDSRPLVMQDWRVGENSEMAVEGDDREYEVLLEQANPSDLAITFKQQGFPAGSLIVEIDNGVPAVTFQDSFGQSVAHAHFAHAGVVLAPSTRRFQVAPSDRFSYNSELGLSSGALCRNGSVEEQRMLFAEDFLANAKLDYILTDVEQWAVTEDNRLSCKAYAVGADGSDETVRLNVHLDFVPYTDYLNGSTVYNLDTGAEA